MLYEVITGVAAATDLREVLVVPMEALELGAGLEERGLATVALTAHPGDRVDAGRCRAVVSVAVVAGRRRQVLAHSYNFV